MSADEHEADVLFDVAMGLKKARARSLRGGGKLADMAECLVMARAVLDHLWLTGQRCGTGWTGRRSSQGRRRIGTREPSRAGA